MMARRLKSLRESKGYKQNFIADKIGIKNNTLSGYESGARKPDPETLSRLADMYEVSVDYLLGRTNDRQQATLTEKDEKDIAKRMKKIKEELMKGNGDESIAFYEGAPLSDEAKESLLQSLEFIERQTKLINKKYIPKKYRKE
ncbi:MAG: helix-turn-helix domain-containing protein [Sporolactobacillus sp.]